MVGEYETLLGRGMPEDRMSARWIEGEKGENEDDRTRLRLGEREAINVRRTGWQ